MALYISLELAHTRTKVHAKKRKIGYSRNFCSAIYTYSTVHNDNDFYAFYKLETQYLQHTSINLNINIYIKGGIIFTPMRDC